ncbi:hypothetical protein HZC32_02415 [Candidatus Woesearchaeota archaeon]|nr:hypothetical protein [Candidatus Woesearchaeota archaeon]
MTPHTKLKLAGLFFGAVLVLNLVLVAFRVTDWLTFWIVLIIVAAVAYIGIPVLKSYDRI